MLATRSWPKTPTWKHGGSRLYESLSTRLGIIGTRRIADKRSGFCDVWDVGHCSVMTESMNARCLPVRWQLGFGSRPKVEGAEMFHMLTCFDLKPDVEIGVFRAAYSDFVEYMQSIDLVERTGPIGQRRSDTKMDTDGERDHEYFVIMSFRDRAQIDAAYARLLPHEEPAETAHKAVFSRVRNQIFICWQDVE